MKSHFAGRDFGEWENSGKKTLDKYIFMKSHFADEERLLGKFFRRRRENSGLIHIMKSHFEDEERLRECDLFCASGGI